MKFSTLTLIALATSTLAVEEKDYKCNTSEASPMVHHVEWIIENTRNAVRPADILCFLNKGCNGSEPPDTNCENCEGSRTYSGEPGGGEHGGAGINLCSGTTWSKDHRPYLVSSNYTTIDLSMFR